MKRPTPPPEIQERMRKEKEIHDKVRAIRIRESNKKLKLAEEARRHEQKVRAFEKAQESTNIHDPYYGLAIGLLAASATTPEMKALIHGLSGIPESTEPEKKEPLPTIIGRQGALRWRSRRSLT
jgi:hypothetical protein